MATVDNTAEKIKKGTSCMNTGLAIFAKTLTLSPVKTRLAADIGVTLAETFYALSLETVTQIVKTAQKQNQNKLISYWALAEEKAVNLACWNKFPALWTGEGDFGKRLHTIYNTLFERYSSVILIGTDSPQLEPVALTSAIKKLQDQSGDCVIGPCPDGGFYLFAAQIPIPEEIWRNVIYSKNTTLQQLSGQLEAHGIKVHLLPMEGDVDTADDLIALINSLATNRHLLPSQQKLYGWLKSQRIGRVWYG